jgi:formate dehydrogenase major subunit
MSINRRQWLKRATGAGIGLAAGSLGLEAPELHASTKKQKLDGVEEFTSACNFCACGCGMICHVKDGELVNLEGDPDHVINEGALCAKGAAMSATHTSERRVKRPRYRAPGSDEWTEISWEEALGKIAHKMKATRDANWTANENVKGVDYQVNRTDAIGFLGGAQNTNEDCYLLTKAARLLGSVSVEHQARLCHGPSVPALAAAFGRGAMTNHWLDMQHSKVFLIEGSNVAENHVMGMKWIKKAQEKGAIVIHVDPRFTRTSSGADIFARIRAGSDIAFLNAMTNYILQHKLYDEEYVKLNTNALLHGKAEFDFNDGVFSGFDEATHHYETTSWEYQLDGSKKPTKAKSLDDPNCVFATLKKFYSRYTLELGSQISGIPVEQIKLIAETMAKHKPGCIVYALGATQHTYGVQQIRCYGILQLLLGNIGVPGGGVNALRGEPNVQGACDMAVLNHYLPGYLNYPNADQPTLKEWTKSNGTFREKFFVNMLKSWFGENATADNDFGYGMLPKRNPAKDYTVYGMMESALHGQMKMLYVIGQNPIVTNANLNVTYAGFAALETLVVQDLWETETAEFWRRPGVDPKTIKTEVFLLPAAYFMEKDGTLTGAGRMVQWRYAAVKPPGEAKTDIEILDVLFNKLRALYKDSTDPKDQPFLKAQWNYPANGLSEAVLREIGGTDLKTGLPVNGIADLQPDGTTACGAWIYAGVFKGGKNLTKRRDNKTDPSGLGIYPGFAWTWPGNMHVLYNRASCDAKGQPLNKDRAIVWWDDKQKKWAGWDTPDVPVATDGPDTPNGQRPFRMNGEGVARLLAAPYKDPDPKDKELPRDVSYTPKDGPLPEFYEPVESPTANAMHPAVATNPCLKYPRLKDGRHPIGTKEKFPYVLMTSSMAEHWCCGSVTRNSPWLNELVPEPVVEIPEKLALKLGLKHGEHARVSSARGEVTVKTVVTKRMQTLNINGEEVVSVWMPYNWGFKGLSTGPSTNVLTIDAVDPVAGTQETKACLVNIVPASDGKGGSHV